MLAFFCDPELWCSFVVQIRTRGSAAHVVPWVGVAAVRPNGNGGGGFPSRWLVVCASSARRGGWMWCGVEAERCCRCTQSWKREDTQQMARVPWWWRSSSLSSWSLRSIHPCFPASLFFSFVNWHFVLCLLVVFVFFIFNTVASATSLYFQKWRKQKQNVEPKI